MKSNEIKNSALAQFVNKGYEATSLEDIVVEVGIKKQSIYSHFKNKEDIFLQVMSDVVHEEIFFLKNYFKETEQLELDGVLSRLLMKYYKRYIKQEDKNLMFLLRMAFMPPYHLRETVINQFKSYNNELTHHLDKAFQKAENLNITSEQGSISFMHLLDGILVEIVYSSDIYGVEDRIATSWEIYWRGITK